MNELRIGIYDLFGNTVEYEGGQDAYDVDSGDWIPVEMLEAIGTYRESFDQAMERTEANSNKEGWGW